MASDLELGLASGLVLLYPRSCFWSDLIAVFNSSHVQEASLRREISRKALMSVISRGMVGDSCFLDWLLEVEEV